MSLQSRLSDLITTIKAAHTALSNRVTAVENRAETVEITQAAYDALSPPDAGTIYIIIG